MAAMKPFARLPILSLLFLSCASCGSGGDDSVVDVAFIGTTDDMFESDVRLDVAGQQIRSATAEGLVALDETGQVTPAVAERWIVTDDGLSYIFRLRNTKWPDGSLLTGDNVRAALLRNINALQRTSFGLDLSKIDEIRAMTGRVIEIRLRSPMPEFLQLLAQPELGLRKNRRGIGPMKLERKGALAILEPLPPQARGLPSQDDWAARARLLRVEALPARRAIDAFNTGAIDVVFGGRLAVMPMADTGALSRGTVRLDAALGLMGLQVKRAQGILATAAGREAIAMAIDRPTLLAPFNIGGWTPTTRVVAPALPGDPGKIGERWTGMSLAQRQAEARRRIAAVAAQKDFSPKLSIAMPNGPGSDLLFGELAEDLSAVGVTLTRASGKAVPDLEMVDQVARYADARWYLNQFNCALRRGVCSPKADALVQQATATTDPVEMTALLTEAEAELTASNAYIPLGAPIRWSLVRGGVTGFAENQWGLHPLFPLSMRPK